MSIQQTDCCICLCDKNIDQDKLVFIINDEKNKKDICNCNIDLHSECFLRWYKENKSCPICRNQIDNDSIYFNTTSDFETLEEINHLPIERQRSISLPDINSLTDQIIENVIHRLENTNQRRPNRRNAIVFRF